MCGLRQVCGFAQVDQIGNYAVEFESGARIVERRDGGSANGHFWLPVIFAHILTFQLHFFGLARRAAAQFADWSMDEFSMTVTATRDG